MASVSLPGWILQNDAIPKTWIAKHPKLAHLCLIEDLPNAWVKHVKNLEIHQLTNKLVIFQVLVNVPFWRFWTLLSSICWRLFYCISPIVGWCPIIGHLPTHVFYATLGLRPGIYCFIGCRCCGSKLSPAAPPNKLTTFCQPKMDFKEEPPVRTGFIKPSNFSCITSNEHSWNIQLYHGENQAFTNDFPIETSM